MTGMANLAHITRITCRVRRRRCNNCRNARSADFDVMLDKMPEGDEQECSSTQIHRKPANPRPHRLPV